MSSDDDYESDDYESDVPADAPRPLDVQVAGSDDYENYDIDEGTPPPVSLNRRAAGLRAAADRIQAETRGLYKQQNVSGLRAVASHAGKAAEIAGRIALFVNDPAVGWQDLWRIGRHDPEWETEVWADWTPPEEEGEGTPPDT